MESCSTPCLSRTRSHRPAQREKPFFQVKASLHLSHFHVSAAEDADASLVSPPPGRGVYSTISVLAGRALEV